MSTTPRRLSLHPDPSGIQRPDCQSLASPVGFYHHRDAIGVRTGSQSL
jgi:hypothetical protein